MQKPDPNPMPNFEKLLPFPRIDLTAIARAVGGFIINRHTIPHTTETPNTGAEVFLEQQLFNEDLSGAGYYGNG